MPSFEWLMAFLLLLIGQYLDLGGKYLHLKLSKTSRLYRFGLRL